MTRPISGWRISSPGAGRSDRVRKCLVIAAGRGSRLASDGPPKPLFRLLGLPLIERAIVTAKRAGLEDFTVVTGYDGLRVRKFLDRLAIRREVALDRGVGGPLSSPSSYFMKHPPEQFTDDVAHTRTEDFIAGRRDV